jgi:hypothetical protein
MAITSVFNRRRTSTTTFGDLFASVCRHPEELVPTKTEKPQKDVPSD